MQSELSNAYDVLIYIYISPNHKSIYIDIDIDRYIHMLSSLEKPDYFKRITIM